MFVKNEQAEELKGIIKEGAFLKLSGVTTIDRYDSQLSIGNVTGMKKIPDFREKRDRYLPGEARGTALPYENE